ncbi:MAG: hypothetical protein ACKO1O_11705 [Erythrobacter sp.]
MTWWTSLTDGQGAFLSGSITAFGAVVAVWIAQKLFGDRVAGLKEGVEQAEQSMSAFKVSVESRLSEIENLFNEVSSGLQRSLADTQAAIHESQGTEGAAEVRDADQAASPWDRLWADWHTIRDKFEAIASSPNIDGRTRAKYSRVDRRSYYELLNLLDADGHLPDLQLAIDATGLWYRSRRKNAVEEAAAQTMRNYLTQISRWQAP